MVLNGRFAFYSVVVGQAVVYGLFLKYSVEMQVAGPPKPASIKKFENSQNSPQKSSNIQSSLQHLLQQHSQTHHESYNSDSSAKQIIVNMHNGLDLAKQASKIKDFENYDPGEIFDHDGHLTMRFGSYSKYLNETIGLQSLKEQKMYALKNFQQQYNRDVADKCVAEDWEKLIESNDIFHLQKVRVPTPGELLRNESYLKLDPTARNVLESVKPFDSEFKNPIFWQNLPEWYQPPWKENEETPENWGRFYGSTSNPNNDIYKNSKTAPKMYKPAKYDPTGAHEYFKEAREKFPNTIKYGLKRIRALPAFYIFSTPKSGTSTLWKILGDHPSIHNHFLIKERPFWHLGRKSLPNNHHWIYKLNHLAYPQLPNSEFETGFNDFLDLFDNEAFKIMKNPESITGLAPITMLTMPNDFWREAHKTEERCDQQHAAFLQKNALNFLNFQKFIKKSNFLIIFSIASDSTKRKIHWTLPRPHRTPLLRLAIFQQKNEQNRISRACSFFCKRLPKMPQRSK